MELGTISNDELIKKIDMLVVREREGAVELLQHLLEVERRGLHVELGYSSMFEYCVRRLKFSEPGASRRLRSAKCLSDFPDVGRLLRDGGLSLSKLSLASGIITKDNGEEVIKEITGKSYREIEEIVARYRTPRAVPKEVIKPVLVRKEKRAAKSKDGSELPLLNVTFSAESKSPSAEVRHEIRFSIDKKTLKKLEQVKVLLSGKYPEGVCLEAVFSEALDAFLQAKCPKKRAARREKKIVTQKLRVKSQSRHIPASTRDKIFVRDGGRCSYVAADGTRCCSSHDLEIDHITPLAKGGTHDPANLRLTCRVHNQLFAEREFGKELVAHYKRKS